MVTLKTRIYDFLVAGFLFFGKQKYSQVKLANASESDVQVTYRQESFRKEMCFSPNEELAMIKESAAKKSGLIPIFHSRRTV
jgi:hypothetical protein